MPEIEGFGDAATGAVWARAVEPRTGEADGHTHETNCLNCGEELVGPYCYRCGQRGHVHRTIAAWWHDFLHSVLHVDGKFWLTLGMLAWRPGELTRRYAHGERARFVSPMALFLFTVFLMFAVFSLIGGPFDNSASGARAQRDLAAETSSLRARAETLERQRAALEASGRPTGTVDARLADVNQELQAIETARNIVLMPNSAPAGETRTLDMRRAEIDTGWPWLDSAIEKARRNPALLLYKMQANAYKFSWAMIPLSVPFVWILFLHRQRYRREFTGYDHLVFVTYSIAFMSLALIALALLDAVGLGVGGLFLLIPPLHMYRQLRGAYGLSPSGAAWRTIALMVFAGVALLLFLLLLLAIGVLG